MHCPGCGADLDGGPIPDDIKHHYSPAHRWGREIGLSNGDSVHSWKCPDCGHIWDRYPSNPVTQEERT